MWYIEAIQPVDGLAFISERPDCNAEPTQVYFVAAPSFQPVPVRNLATALWATRGTFQERFFTPPPSSPASGVPSAPPQPSAPSELAFKSLPQPIELTRRFYLASGPLQSPGGTTPMMPTLPSGSPSGPASNLIAGWQKELQDLAVGTRPRVAEILDQLMGIPEHRQALQEFAVNALAQMEVATSDSMEHDEHRAAFVVLLGRTGLWDGYSHIMTSWVELHETQPKSARNAPPRWQGGRLTGSSVAIQHRIMAGLFFQIPAPIAFAPYERGLPTLGHHLCAGLSDRAFLATLTASQRLIPLQLAALLLAAGTVDLVPGSTDLRGAVTKKANRWLARNLPDSSLAKIPAAEEVVSAVTLRMAHERESSLLRAEESAERERQRTAHEREQMAPRGQAIGHAHDLYSVAGMPTIKSDASRSVGEQKPPRAEPPRAYG